MTAEPAVPSRPPEHTGRAAWRVASWCLLAVSLAAAGLEMAHVRAGFWTSHAADLCLPPWLYIAMRRLASGEPSHVVARSPWSRWLGRTPERAAVSLFAASTLTELSQIRWPHGIFRGTYDPLDIAAYAAGLAACWAADRLALRRRPVELGPARP